MHSSLRSKLLSGAVAATGATLILGACAPTSQTSSTAPAGTVSPVGYSALFLQDPAQSAMVASFKKAAGGDKVLPPTSANGDAGQQDSDIRNLVTAGAKSLMVIPADAKAVVPSIKYARDKGLPVATLMLGPSGGPTDISLQVDNTAVGVQACEYLAEKVGDKGTVLAIQGDMRQSTAQERDAGFNSCMKDNHPGITVILKTGGQWDPATAAASAAAVANSTPELGGIFMTSDGYVNPVAQVLKQRGRTAAPGERGHVWTIAVDGTPTALDAIRGKSLDADLSQPVDQFVTQGLAYLRGFAAGKPPTEGPTDHGSKIIKTSDGYLADVFDAKLITADNVDDAEHWANGK